MNKIMNNTYLSMENINKIKMVLFIITPRTPPKRLINQYCKNQGYIYKYIYMLLAIMI